MVKIKSQFGKMHDIEFSLPGFGAMPTLKEAKEVIAALPEEDVIRLADVALWCQSKGGDTSYLHRAIATDFTQHLVPSRIKSAVKSKLTKEESRHLKGNTDVAQVIDAEQAQNLADRVKLPKVDQPQGARSEYPRFVRNLAIEKGISNEQALELAHNMAKGFGLSYETFVSLQK